MTVQARHIEVAARAHVVKFYEHDGELVAAVAPYLAAAIDADEVALMIATQPHRRAFESALEGHGVDLERATAQGRLLSLDAAATMSEFRSDAKIDHDAFHGVVGGLLRAAAATGRPVRAYGEMVSLLWDAGDVLAAIELEKLWHELGRRLPFTLFCSYPAASVAPDEHMQALAQICHLHSPVLGPVAEHAGEPPRACAQTGISAPFAADPDSPGQARRLVVDALRRWGAAHTLIDDVALVVSELTTNAVRHADSSFSITIRASASILRVVVHDGAPSAPVPEAWLTPRPLHGLSLVDALCTRWGVENTRHGKLVWAELPYASCDYDSRPRVAFDSDQAEQRRVPDAGAALDGAPQLELRDDADGPRHVLVLNGELDMASSPALDEVVHEICTDSAEALTVDLSGLTFMDSTGLRVVLLAKELCERHSCEFLLIPGPAQIQRLFEVTGILERLPFSG